MHTYTHTHTHEENRVKDQDHFDGQEIRPITISMGNEKEKNPGSGSSLLLEYNNERTY